MGIGTEIITALKDYSQKVGKPIVLNPEPGFYSDSPIGVCDFASLYPSTIVSENISLKVHFMLLYMRPCSCYDIIYCLGIV